MAGRPHRHDMASAMGGSKAHFGKILGAPEPGLLDEDGECAADLRIEVARDCLLTGLP